MFLISGGLVGSVTAYNMSSDYKSLLQVIHELNYEKQKKLFDTIQNLVTSIDINDVVKFALIIATNQSLKQAIIYETINFVRNELSMQIAQN